MRQNRWPCRPRSGRWAEKPLSSWPRKPLFLPVCMPKIFKPQLTGKTSAIVKGVRGWRQYHFTTNSMHVSDQSSVRTSRAAADQWCRPSVTVPRVTDRKRRPSVNHVSSLTSVVDRASITGCRRWPVSSTTTCCCHGPALSTTTCCCR